MLRTVFLLALVLCVWPATSCSGDSDCNSPNGVCDGTQCICTAWWAGSNCATARPRALCANDCSNRGICTPLGCECLTQWTGADCSLRTCPSFAQWVGYADSSGTMHSTKVECSNAGTCDRMTGQCKCQSGFAGRACELLACPNACSGQGTCIALSQAASQRDGIGLFRQVSYSNWDAARIFGCRCNPGYAGYDCSELTCPVGDDPMSGSEADEIQVVDCMCSATCSGSFSISFGPYTTVAIAHDATAAVVKVALETLPNIESVDVSLTGGSTICDTSAVSTAITFTHTPGDVPTLRLNTGTLSSSSGVVSLVAFHSGQSSTNGVASLTGTKQSWACSGRGSCDSTKGRCSCYAGFASSDGRGSQGTRADCGHIVLPTVQLETTTNGDGTNQEVQTVRCSASGGTVTLSVPTEDTDNTVSLAAASAVAYTVTAAALQTVLQAVSNSMVASVTSSPTTISALCDSFGSSTFSVTFNHATSTTKDLPTMTYTSAHSVSSCPGAPAACSGHGTCSDAPGYVCACHEGWQGLDCSQREPGHSLTGYVSVTNGGTAVSTTADLTGEIFAGDTIVIDGHESTLSTAEGAVHSSTTLTLASAYIGSTVTYAEAAKNPADAHYPVECSGRGTCLRASGVCSCLRGFTGSACERVACPLDNKRIKSCNGRGTCESLARLAELTTDEQGLATAFSYGQNPGELGTWDHDKLYGCHCDAGAYENGISGYFGHDCSLRNCPKGDDPSTPNGDVEVQSLTCTGSSGSFTLKFRGETTSTIAFNADAAAVEAALESLGTINDVQVAFSCGNTVCDASGRNTASVTFVAHHGDVPTLTSIDTTVEVSISTTIPGTTDNAECGRQGICDTTLGVCKCIAGYVGEACEMKPNSAWGIEYTGGSSTTPECV